MSIATNRSPSTDLSRDSRDLVFVLSSCTRCLIPNSIRWMKNTRREMAALALQKNRVWAKKRNRLLRIISYYKGQGSNWLSILLTESAANNRSPAHQDLPPVPLPDAAIAMRLPKPM